MLPCASGALSGAPFKACCWVLRSAERSTLCVFDLLGRNGTGELGREDRNYRQMLAYSGWSEKIGEREGLTEEAAPSKAKREDWTTSSCIPTPQTF